MFNLKNVITFLLVLDFTTTSSHLSPIHRYSDHMCLSKWYCKTFLFLVPLSHILMHVPLYPQSPIFLKLLLNAYERQGFYYSQCVIIGLKLIKKYASMDMSLLKSKDCCQREQTIQEYLKTKHETVRPNFSFFLSLLYLLSK